MSSNNTVSELLFESNNININKRYHSHAFSEYESPSSLYKTQRIKRKEQNSLFDSISEKVILHIMDYLSINSLSCNNLCAVFPRLIYYRLKSMTTYYEQRDSEYKDNPETGYATPDCCRSPFIEPQSLEVRWLPLQRPPSPHLE